MCSRRAIWGEFEGWGEEGKWGCPMWTRTRRSKLSRFQAYLALHYIVHLGCIDDGTMEILTDLARKTPIMLSRTRRTIPYTASGLSQLSRQPYRCISCSLRLAQSPAQSQSQSQPQDAQTTHFGFETVEESKKASRGEPACPRRSCLLRLK